MGKVNDIKYAKGIQFNVESQKGVGVTIFGVQYDKIIKQKFLIGEEAVYDYYNYEKTGHIVSITDKSVIIAKYGKRKRLTLEAFARWNFDYDAERIARDRHEYSHYN